MAKEAECKGSYRGKIVNVEKKPYHILDVIQDPAYPKHFLNRFKIQRDHAVLHGTAPWFLAYKDNPELLLNDAIDEIKVILKLQETSAAQIDLIKYTNGPITKIILPAVGDWIHEKEGTERPYEPLPDTVKSIQSNYKAYYVYKERFGPKNENGR